MVIFRNVFHCQPRLKIMNFFHLLLKICMKNQTGNKGNIKSSELEIHLNLFFRSFYNKAF